MDAMVRQAIDDASCEEDSCDGQYQIDDKSMEVGDDEDTEPSIDFEVSCSCGREGTVTIDTDGTSADGSVVLPDYDEDESEELSE